MKILFHGNDDGGALPIALMLIAVLSLILMSAVPRIIASERLAEQEKKSVLEKLEKENREIMRRYDTE